MKRFTKEETRSGMGTGEYADRRRTVFLSCLASQGRKEGGDEEEASGY